MKKVGDKVVLTEEEYRKLLKRARLNKEKMSTSKRILVIVWTLSTILIALCVIMAVFTDKSITDLVTLTGIVTGCTAADTAVYSWKAKAENKIKLTKSLVDELADKHGIDAVVSLASTLLTD